MLTNWHSSWITTDRRKKRVSFSEAKQTWRMVSSMAAFLGYCCGAGTCLALWCMMCIYKTMWCIFYIYIVTNDLHMFWIKIFIYDRYVRYLWYIIIMSLYIMNYLWLFVYTCSNGIWINSFGYPEMGISPVLWWSAMEYGWIWNTKMLGERAHFFWSFIKFKHYRYPLEKATSTCLSSQISLWFAAAFSAIFWPWESQSVGRVLYVLLSYSNYYIIRFTDWLLTTE